MDFELNKRPENNHEAVRINKRIEYLIKFGWAALDKKKDWKKAHQRFTRAQELLAVTMTVDSDFEQDFRMKKVESQFGVYYSCIIRDRSLEEMIQNDLGASIKNKHKQIETLIKQLGIFNNLSLWNMLEQRYDKLEIASIADGRTYEAAEANYAMMRSRRFRFHAAKDKWHYYQLTLADHGVGFGHRLRYALAWIYVILIGFAVIYFLGHSYLTVSGEFEEIINRTLKNTSTWTREYIHSVWISFAMLFAPTHIHVTANAVFMKVILVLNSVTQYVVNVGLIALIVNKLAARRKW